MAIKYEQGKEPKEVSAPSKPDPNELDDKAKDEPKKRDAKNKARTTDSK